MSQNQFSLEDVSKLLARKRLEVPSEDYFRGVLPEFHRRLEQSAARTPWMRFLDAFSGTLAPRLTTQYALPVMAAVGLAVLTLSGLSGSSSQPADASMLALQVAPAESAN